ncbi:MAG: adenosylcobinamide-phosphate synthase CbiB, partial [Halocynthiibacter sp.]
LMGRLIGWADERFNTGSVSQGPPWSMTGRRAKGIALVLVLCAASALLGLALSALPFGYFFEVLLASILLAHKSLVQHVAAVADALRLSPGDGRRAVAHIVGRDTSDMDPAATARAAIESAAENFSDGVVAPAFWFLIAGLPGILIYKIINTADSMIGYKTRRYEEFGWAAARLDDVLNWLPARITALLIIATSWRTGNWLSHVWPILQRDARQHRSPNAGWPEAAMATVLSVALAGPRSYEGALQDFPFVYPEGRRDIGAGDIDAAVTALWRCWAALLVITLIVAIF